MQQGLIVLCSGTFLRHTKARPLLAQSLLPVLEIPTVFGEESFLKSIQMLSSRRSTLVSTPGVGGILPP